MDLPIQVSPVPHEATTIQDDSLTPLLLGMDGSDLDGFDLDDVFNPDAALDLCDLLSLAVDEPDPAPVQQQRQPQQQPQPQQQQQQQQQQPKPQHQLQHQSHEDAGNDGDVSSVMSEVDFNNYRAKKDGHVRSPSEVGETNSWSDTACCHLEAGGNKNSAPMTLSSTPRTTTSWSTTSASEDSDDSSPMSVSSCCPANIGGRAPIPPDVGSQKNNQNRKHGAAAAAAPAAAPSAEAATTSGTAAEVKSSVGTTLLPLAYAPSFDGAAGYASSCPAMPLGFGSSQPTAFAAAASGAVGQLTAYLKRQYDCGSGGGGRDEERGGGGQRASRLLSGNGGGEGGGGGLGGRVSKKAKKEERLMKNREAANRSRAKVRCFPPTAC